ncbi:MAG: T9SS type A sorting domain-containing protein, partial [Flavobacteriales bacterium]|nr:T9SS type A sorting domain-containing protein [Flavobacteriales bacterium]
VTNQNGCFSSDDAFITINPYPVVSLGADTVFCNKSNGIISPGIGYTSYLWNDSSTIQSLLVNSTGHYWVEVSNGFNCVSRDSIFVKFSSLKLSIGNDTTVCGSHIVDAGPGYASYLWSTSDTTAAINVQFSGTYVLTVSNNDGCVEDDTINVVVNPLPVPNLIGPDSICKGDTLILDAGSFASYLWSTSDTTQSVELTLAGTYYVDVIDINGCMGSDTFKLAQKDCAPPDGIFEHDFSSLINIWPNPVKQNVFLKWKQSSSASTISLLDMQGRVLETHYWLQNDVMMLNLESYSNGVYIIQVSSQTERLNIPIIKN